MRKISYARHRFPPEIIQHAVWLYFRFPLSYRDVEDLLSERGVDVSYETVRRWALRFGQAYAYRLRRFRSRSDARWLSLLFNRSPVIHRDPAVSQWRMQCRTPISGLRAP